MTVRDPLFLDGLVSAEEARLGLAAGWTPGASGVLARSGVMPGPGTPLRVHQTGTASGSLLVDAGSAAVQGTTSATQGVYVGTNDAQITLAYLATYPADANPRKDLIVARIADDDYAGASNAFTIEVVKGTASGSPVDPTVPASSLVLARVNLPASATTVADAVIDDLRPYTVARGGILPIGSGAVPSGPFIGECVYDASGRLRVWDGAQWNSPRPSIVGVSSAVTADPTATSGTTQKTLASVSVTADGVNQIEVAFTWYGVKFSVAGDRFDVQLYMDSTQVGAVALFATAVTLDMEGGTARAIIGPGAGTYTVSARIQRVAGTGTADVYAGATAPMLLTARQFV